MLDSRQMLRVFISHAHEDGARAHPLFALLKAAGADPWLDNEKLEAGQDWKLEIEAAIRSTDTCVLLLTTKSVNKVGFFQKEMKLAWEAAQLRPDRDNFLVPIVLDECDVPDRVRDRHYVKTFELLFRALESRADALKRRSLRLRRSSKTQQLVAEFELRNDEQPPVLPPWRAKRRMAPVVLFLVLAAGVAVTLPFYNGVFSTTQNHRELADRKAPPRPSEEMTSLTQESQAEDEVPPNVAIVQRVIATSLVRQRALLTAIHARDLDRSVELLRQWAGYLWTCKWITADRDLRHHLQMLSHTFGPRLSEDELDRFADLVCQTGVAIHAALNQILRQTVDASVTSPMTRLRAIEEHGT